MLKKPQPKSSTVKAITEGQATRYVIPHRRASEQTAAQGTATDTYIPPGFRKTNYEKHVPVYTAHGKLRKQQRQISHQSIKTLFKNGTKQGQGDSGSVYIDSKTIGVVAKKGQIITVGDNKRNTQFDILHASKDKERSLIQQANMNNDAAMCDLATLYLSGELGNREVKKAYDWLIKAAQYDNSHAMCLLAQIHEAGDMGKADQATATEWYEKAAEHNNRGALAILGQRYLMEYIEINQKLQADPKSVIETEQLALLNKAQNYLERAAKKGATRAMWTLANVYEKGLLGKTDIQKAIELYSKAAKLGSPSSLDSLYQLVQAQKMEANTFDSILEEASMLVAKTSSHLAVQLAVDQIAGRLGKNAERGISMLTLAAKNRNVEAIKVLIKYYQNGYGCAQDVSKAEYWIEALKKLYFKATQQGNVVAMLDLASLYLDQKFGKVDIEKAEQFFSMAASTGDIDAIFRLGEYYIETKLGAKQQKAGVEFIGEAISLWEQGAKENDPEAIQALINVYLNPKLGFKDLTKASKCLRLSFKLGEKSALTTLARMHMQGIQYDLPPAEYIEEITAFKILADKEHPLAMAALAILYKANVMEKNKTEANVNPWIIKLEALLKREGETNAKAASFLGSLYRAGNILPRHLGEATKWFFHAATLPEPNSRDFEAFLQCKTFTEEEKKKIVDTLHEIASQSKEEEPFIIGRVLGDIYSQGILSKIDYEKAYLWYEKSAQLGNSIAMCELGALYQSGAIGKQNHEQAILWYDLSAKKGNARALQFLAKLNDVAGLEASLKVKIEPWLKQFSELKKSLQLQKMKELNAVQPPKLIKNV